MLQIRIRDPMPFNPGSGIRVSGSGIRNRFFPIPDPGSKTHIFDSLMNNFWVKSSIILSVLTKKFPLLFRCYCWIRDPGSGIRDPGSGMDKNQNPGSWINIPDPQHWYIALYIRRSRLSCFFIQKYLSLDPQAYRTSIAKFKHIAFSE